MRNALQYIVAVVLFLAAAAFSVKYAITAVRNESIVVPVAATPSPTPTPTAHAAATWSVDYLVYVKAEQTPAPVKYTPDWAYPLDADELETVCRIVMGEAGGEPREGQIAVAQCILNGCKREGMTPGELRKAYKYAGWREDYTDAVRDAVLAVFRDGERVTDEPITVFYSPACARSSWHEAQQFVCEIGGHRFFVMQ